MASLLQDQGPLDFAKWLAENRHLLKPPVGNQQIWPGREFMVTVVGGPNSRTDYHINEGEEFFWQLEGDMVLRVLEDGQKKDVPIAQGAMFLLPGNVPHSPQRPAGTVGLVIERKRLPGELDGFLWVCDACGEKLYEEFLPLQDIVTDLPPVFERFWSEPSHTTCRACGHTHTRPPRAT
jgi:3-hydroxyanthranilate 3,4-dioxygenase